MRIYYSLLLIVLLIPINSCKKEDESSFPVNGGVLAPVTETTQNDGDAEQTPNALEETLLPLVNPGEGYSILTLSNRNLDTDTSDEQVLLAASFDNEEEPLILIIASANTIRNEYSIAWKKKLNTRTLTDINLRLEDLTGNGRDDIVVIGFDTSGQHVTEVFAVPENGEITDYVRVFSLSVKGNIDVSIVDRTADYYSGLAEGTPYSIIVQEMNPESDNDLDLIETRWKWVPRNFVYTQSESLLIEAETILEERMEKLYAGNASTYEDYLHGTWYRESGDRAYEDILYFNKEKREIMFYDGSALESFIWGKSHRTTSKRLYFKMKNSVVPSLVDTVYVSVDTWDSIDLSRSFGDWNHSYRRFNSSLQAVFDSRQSRKTLLESRTFPGVWESHGDQKIVINLPRIEWYVKGKKRVGTASFFSIDGTTILQVQFLKDDNFIEETQNWIVSYNQDNDNAGIVQSLTLSPAVLSTSGAAASGTEFLRFEQIEKISSVD